MKKVLFVINTLGGAGAEKALLELLKRFPENEYEVSLYVLLAQGELIHQVPEQVKILNQSYSDASVLSKKGKHILNQQIFKRLLLSGQPIRLQTSFCERSYFQKSWIYAQKYGRNAEKRKALSG